MSVAQFKLLLVLFISFLEEVLSFIKPGQISTVIFKNFLISFFLVWLKLYSSCKKEVFKKWINTRSLRNWVYRLTNFVFLMRNMSLCWRRNFFTFFFICSHHFHLRFRWCLLLLRSNWRRNWWLKDLIFAAVFEFWGYCLTFYQLTSCKTFEIRIISSYPKFMNTFYQSREELLKVWLVVRTECETLSETLRLA